VAFRHRESRLKNFCNKLLKCQWMINVCFAPESGHLHGCRKRSAYDLKRPMESSTRPRSPSATQKSRWNSGLSGAPSTACSRCRWASAAQPWRWQSRARSRILAFFFDHSPAISPLLPGIGSRFCALRDGFLILGAESAGPAAPTIFSIGYINPKFPVKAITTA
jgi:hypothetical protein